MADDVYGPMVDRLEYGEVPPGLGTGPALTNATPVPEGIFSAADLLGLYQAEEFPMPRGKKVWVHPVGLEEVTWIAAMGAQYSDRNRTVSPEVRDIHRLQWGWVFQVICCCRQGPEPDAPRVFTPKQANALFRGLSYETARRIAALSDRLGGDQERLQGALRGFFEAIRDYAATWSLPSTTDSVEAYRAAFSTLASFVSSTLSQGSLTAEQLPNLPAPPRSE